MIDKQLNCGREVKIVIKGHISEDIGTDGIEANVNLFKCLPQPFKS